MGHPPGGVSPGVRSLFGPTVPEDPQDSGALVTPDSQSRSRCDGDFAQLKVAGGPPRRGTSSRQSWRTRSGAARATWSAGHRSGSHPSGGMTTHPAGAEGPLGKRRKKRQCNRAPPPVSERGTPPARTVRSPTSTLRSARWCSDTSEGSSPTTRPKTSCSVSSTKSGATRIATTLPEVWGRGVGHRPQTGDRSPPPTAPHGGPGRRAVRNRRRGRPRAGRPLRAGQRGPRRAQPPA